MTYSLLSDFDATRDDWLIKVRVCRTWEFIYYKRSPYIISLDMIPIDEKVHIIHILRFQFLISLFGIVLHIDFSKGIWMHAIILNNQVNMFRDKLSDGSAVFIKNIKVSALTGDYRPVQSNFKITFLRKTAIQKLQDDIVHIP